MIKWIKRKIEQIRCKHEYELLCVGEYIISVDARNVRKEILSSFKGEK